MLNRYYKNFILCGEIDYYCLLCKEKFHVLSEVNKHVRWETHRKFVKGQLRYPKFRKDAVYKFGEKFYCEVCNYMEPDLNAMLAHVCEEAHKINKEKPKTDADIANSGCLRDSGYVIVSDAIVDNRDWHGILDGECVICCKPVVSSVAHIGTTEHVLKLIEAKVTFEDKDKFYRKVARELFYCFVCRAVIPLTALESHWTDQDHYEKRKTVIFRATATKTSSANEDKRIELAKRLIGTQKDFFDIFMDKEITTCKKCKCILPLDFKAMINHQKIHKDDVVRSEQPVIVVESPSSSDEGTDEVVYHEVQDHGKRRAEMSKYGKDNYIKLNPGGSRGYCSLCHTYLSGSLRLFKEHVRGARHKNHLELKGIRKAKDHTMPEAKSKPLTDYFMSLYYSRPVRVLWVNKQFCVDIQSFILVCDVEKNPHYRKTKCFACDIYYPQGQDVQHFQTEEHKRKFLNVKVLTMRGEFIREIRTDLYHCGFCNKVYPFWELMQKHIQKWNHLQKKNDKDLVLRIAQQWYDENILNRPSNNPDILYIQLIRMGIFMDHNC